MTEIKEIALTYKKGAALKNSVVLESGERLSLESFLALRESEGFTVEDAQAELAQVCGSIPLADSPSESNKVAPFGSPVSIENFLNADPPECEEIFEALLMRGIVGGLFAQGGTGKTYLLICLMLSLALGLPFFRTFRPSKPMRVLALLGEDPPEMIHARIKSILEKYGDDIDHELLIQNLRLYCGKAAPFMQLKNGNPSVTEAFNWLKAEVEDFKPDLIIIDPKSMFYGLDENSNDDNTRWIVALKELTTHRATVLFSHHVTKALSGSLELGGARGGGALVDGSRFAVNMRQMTEEDAKKYDIDEPWRYVEFRVTKNSYIPKLPGSIFFKFTEGGALEEVDLQASKEFVMVEALVTTLTSEAAKGNYPTRREVEREGSILPEYTQRDRKKAVELALSAGRISIEKDGVRTVLRLTNQEVVQVVQDDCAELII